ncbi:MAG: hypothetical protein HYR96_08635 [Deltaproteobacteria bacterium]|nr:hypothetical protein [Deltaproteobacteria bacterium]MBI3294677.1 hypothetical protein [Deltaproteobacteria bacterium]
MKTTFEISESLLREAKKYAAQKGISLKAVVESALRNILSQNQRPGKFKLRKASFKGQGMQDGVREGDWAAIREKIYRGRGE